MEQGGPWGFRHQFNIADAGFGLRAPRVWNDRAGEVGRTLSAEEFDVERIFGQEGVGILHLSGLIAAMSEQTTACCLALAKAVKQYGTLVSFDLNYRATFWQGRKKALLNISSMNAYTPLTKIPAYSGAKAAVSNFTQWLAVHFSKVGIRVNAIAPGFFSTAQNAALLWNADGTPTARTGKILAATPMERFGKPEELIGATLFLMNAEAASFVTGAVIPVDGGFSAYSGV